MRDSIDWGVPYLGTQTIYLPTSQIIFTVLRFCEEQVVGEPPSFSEFIKTEAGMALFISGGWRTALFGLPWQNQLIIWRIGFAIFALIATWFLLLTLAHLGRSPWWAVLFAWHPLTIVETAGMAHQDAVGIALLMAAIWAWICGSLSLRERAGVRGLADSLSLENP
ncbi:MAG: hypothetical protein H7144_17695, partial [Burkholderiales bacterium]|nr:hypothetical protein [Phycisphaerae bacterium]